MEPVLVFGQDYSDFWRFMTFDLQSDSTVILNWNIADLETDASQLFFFWPWNHYPRNPTGRKMKCVFLIVFWHLVHMGQYHRDDAPHFTVWFSSIFKTTGNDYQTYLKLTESLHWNCPENHELNSFRGSYELITYSQTVRFGNETFVLLRGGIYFLGWPTFD